MNRKVTVSLDHDTWIRLQNIRLKDEDRTISDVVREAISLGLKKAEKRARRGK